MANKRVEIEVNGKVMVSADVSKAKADLASLTSGTVGAGGSGPSGAPSTIGSGNPTGPRNERDRNWMDNAAWRMFQTASGSLGSTRTEREFQRLGDRIERATGYAAGAGNDTLVQALKDLRETMERRRADLNAPPPPGGAPAPAPGGGAPVNLPQGQGMPPWMQRAGQWLSQQGGNSALGGVGRWIGGPTANALMGGSLARLLTGPIGMGLGAVTALNYAFNATANNVKEENAPARNEMLGMADLARQYGSDRNLFFNFRNGYGQTNPRFRELGYTATQAAHTAALLDRPGGMMNDTTSVLQYARTMGVDESKVASITRAFGIAGVGGPRGGHADEGLRVMKLAVSEGIKAGIAGSDTMNALVGFASRNLSEGRNTSAAGLASMSQIMARLNASGSAVLRGEAGASVMQRVMGGIGNADPGMEYLMLNAIGAPSAKSVGLSGKDASTYEQLRRDSPLEASRYLLSRVQGGDNPGLRAQVMKAIDGAAGGNTGLQMRMYQSAFGLSSQEAFSMISSGGLSSVFGTDPKDLERRKQGANLKDDVQGGNRVAGQTLEYRTAEQDREMMRSLGYLKNLEGMEGKLNDIYSVMADTRAVLADAFSGSNTLGGTGSMGGRAGQWFKPPSPLTQPGTSTAPKSEGTGSVAGDAQRTVAAVAQVESKNGTMAGMNAPKPGGAVGLFQMQSKWLPPQANGNPGWAAEAKVEMRNPDGSRVTTEAQARAWQLANPTKANQIAVSRLTAIEQQIRARAAKEGVTLTPQQIAGYVGLVWHSNGGASLAPILRGGKLITDVRYLSSAKHGDGISDRVQYDRVTGAFGLPSLAPAATGLDTPPAPGQGGAGGKPPAPGAGGQDKKMDSLNDRFEGQVKNLFAAWRAKYPGGLVPTINEAFRSRERQAELYAQGRNGNPGQIVTSARPGESAHNHGLAIDVVWQDPRTGKNIDMSDPRSIQAYKALGAMAGQVGLQWLGRFGDMPHFEAMGFDGKNAAKGILPKGYARGGYTGDAGRGDPAGIVHGQEFVVNAQQTARYRGLLESLNAGTLPQGGVTVNVGGRIEISATLSAPARSAIEARADVFRRDTAQIVQADLISHKGPR